MSVPFVVAVDGPAASGKSTIARELARRLGLAFLDTGLLYRAVARRLLEQGADPADRAAVLAAARALDAGAVDPGSLKGDTIGQVASRIAALPEVRDALLPVQRRFATRPPGAVLAGRDVGTVVCPDAAVKLFVTADPAVRARRRALELRAGGAVAIEARVLEDMLERDRRDQDRAVAPLRVAEDAVVIDTTALDVEASIAAAVDIVERSRRARGSRLPDPLVHPSPVRSPGGPLERS